jgi:hypothetical protein
LRKPHFAASSVKAPCEKDCPTAEREDILSIGGFSDQVFEVVSAFASGRREADHWIARIEAVEVYAFGQINHEIGCRRAAVQRRPEP